MKALFVILFVSSMFMAVSPLPAYSIPSPPPGYDFRNGVVDAGGPYSFCLGDDLTLTASAWSVIGVPGQYYWELNNDSLFDDALGSPVTLTAAQYASYFPSAGDYPIAVFWYVEINGMYGLWSQAGDKTIVTARDCAVPEPATMLLLGSGLIGLAGYERKKFF